MVLPDLNFQSQDIAIRHQCNPQPDTPNFPDYQHVPSFHELEVKSDVTRKAPEILKADKQFTTRMANISFPIKFGENSRKRKRTDEGVKSALQRKMEHLDKEKERR